MPLPDAQPDPPPLPSPQGGGHAHGEATGDADRAPERPIDRRNPDRAVGSGSAADRAGGWQERRRDRRDGGPGDRPDARGGSGDGAGAGADKRRGESPGLRLQKALARAGVASRRDCEQLIEAGRVTLNGEIPQGHPVFVNPEVDRVEVDGIVVRIDGRHRENDERGPNRGIGARRTYLMVNKPKKVVCTVEDEPEFRDQRKTIIDVVDPALRGRARLFPVGRLDAESTGLVLLTDDGDMAHRLTHPSFEITKRYEVTVRGRVEESDLAQLREGLFLTTKRPKSDGQPNIKRASAEKAMILGRQVDRDRGDLTVLGITLTEGQNREIRRLMAQLGFKVRRLKRNAIGPLELKGLAVGEARPLARSEVTHLRRITGLLH